MVLINQVLLVASNFNLGIYLKISMGLNELFPGNSLIDKGFNFSVINNNN